MIAIILKKIGRNNMTIPEASKKLNLSEQLLRVWAQQEKGCPFITIVRDGKRKSYVVNEARMKMWAEGKI